MNETVKLTITDATKKILSNYPYMEEFLESKCVNFSALAEKITPKIKEIIKKDKINKEAVIMSVIRYAQTLKNKNVSKPLLLGLSKSNITIKTDMMYINIPKSLENLRLLESFYQKIKWDKGEIFFIVQGISEISVVLDKSNYELLIKKIKKEDVEIQFPSTAIVIVHSSPEFSSPGGIHYITKPIAEAGISVEMHTMLRDTIFLVDEKNSSRLFEILKDMIDSSRKLI